MSLDDERKAISNLICGFVRTISFGRDFEQQLSFYVEARAAFTNLDIVLVQLIQVGSLGTDTLLTYWHPVGRTLNDVCSWQKTGSYVTS